MESKKNKDLAKSKAPLDLIAQSGLSIDAYIGKLDEYFRFANILIKSKLIPSNLDSPEKVLVALWWGVELGLSPMVAINNVVPINGMPSVKDDAARALAMNKGKIKEWKDEELYNSKGEYVGHRVELITDKGIKYTQTFTLHDANNAGLLGKDNWRKYPKAMCFHRASAFIIRKACPEVIAGLYTTTEVEEFNGKPGEIFSDADKLSEKDKELETKKEEIIRFPDAEEAEIVEEEEKFEEPENPDEYHPEDLEEDEEEKASSETPDEDDFFAQMESLSEEI